LGLMNCICKEPETNFVRLETPTWTFLLPVKKVPHVNKFSPDF
jgi:hypothetical protein